MFHTENSAIILDKIIHQTRPKVAIFASRFPYPLEKGDKLRLFYQLRGLHATCDLYLFAIGEEEISKSDFEHILPFVKEIHFYRLDLFNRILAVLTGFNSGLPWQTLFFYNDDIKKSIGEKLKIINPDHLYCQLARMACYVSDLPYKKTLDYMDAFGVGMERRVKVARWPIKWIYKKESRLMKKYEQKLLSEFDHFTIISDQDCFALTGNLKNDKIIINSNGIDDSFFTYPEKDKIYDLLFVGNMGYLPNIEAAEFLVKKIIPLLPAGINLLIAGARPHRRVLELQSDSVKVGGWYDDIREAYAGAKVFVAPIWSGTGQQNKILEAMAMKLPCITTAVVNNAIRAEDGLQIVLANDEKTFAEKIKKLLDSHETRLYIGSMAKKFVKQNYSWNNNIESLSRIFASK